MKKFLFFIFISLSVLFLSCETGLGQAVDLDAPELKILSLTSGENTVTSTAMAGGVYCHKKFTIRGTADDNIKVESVYAEIKWSDQDDYRYFAKATLNGDKWYLNVDLPKEGVAYLKFVATDYPGNVSVKSSSVVTLFIDETGPVGTAWYIDRGRGYRYSLQDLDYLKALDLNLAENKDAAQNVEFSIHADFNDTMGIKPGSVKIQLRKEDGTKICDVENSAQSLYAPCFDINASMLSSLTGTAPFYIQVWYDAEDVVTVPAPNKIENEPIGWFIWDPASDIPKIIPQTTIESNEINLKIKDTLSLSVFDDDGLKGTFTYKMFETGKENDPLVSKQETFNEEREKTVILKAPDKPVVLTLKGSVKDLSGKTANIQKTVNVTDGSSPILIIESPESNTIPKVEMADGDTKANITIKGQTLDTLGSEYLEFIWVPDQVTTDNSQKHTKALEWFETINSASSAPTGNNSYKLTTSSEGMKLWSVKLTQASSEGDFQKHTFEFTLDLLNDFKAKNNTNEKMKDKYFLVRLTRLDGNKTDKEYVLSSDSEQPSINPITPSGDMATKETTEDLILEFNGSKSSCLAMDPNGYKIERIESSGNTLVSGGFYDDTSKTYKATITASELEQMETDGIKPKYRFTAKDIFGREGFAQYTIIIKTNPVLKSITTSSPSKVKTGETIVVNLNFSDTVNINENLTDEKRPYLKIKGITNASNSDKDKAYYSGGSGSTSLQFSYTVQPGDYTDGTDVFDVYADSGTNPLVLNDAAAFANTCHLDEAWSNSLTEKKIMIDGIAPQVTGITLSHDADEDKNKDKDGTIWLKEGRKLTATVKVDDKVSVQGSPVIRVKAGDNNLDLPFESISQDEDGKTTIIFAKKIASTDAQGKLTFTNTDSSPIIYGYDDIKDSFGNGLDKNSITSKTVTGNYAVDTIPPAEFTIKNKAEIIKYPGATTISAGTPLTASHSGNYQTLVTFIIDTSSDDTIKSTEYSLDGGSTWKDYTSEFTIDSTKQVTAQRTDWAGNTYIIPYTVDFDINNTFPSYTLECTNANGYYKAGDTLSFKISFAAPVNIAADSTALIYLDGQNPTDLTGEAGNGTNPKAVATLDDSCKGKTYTASATFTYKVQKNHQFKLKVAANAIQFTGIVDSYGISGRLMNSDYIRDINCDGIIPYITNMTSAGEKITTDGSLTVYPSGNVITLTFNEPVQKGSGNIILRQVKGWAIPPVINGADFNTILNAITSDCKVGNLTGSQVLYMDGAQDSEWIYGAKVGPTNDQYHGTGQYIGPYKKSSYGVNDDGSPKTDAQYVLDFDMDIWETDTTHYFGTTYVDGHASGDSAANSYSRTTTYTNNSGVAKLKDISKNTKITVGDIRTVLEKVGYHQRVIDVTNAKVVLSNDNKTVTITFPKGLTGNDDALPDGREWELVIEKGAFLDYAEHEFGSEYKTNSNDIERTDKDSIMKSDGTLTSILGEWATNGRGRTSATDPVVLIQTSNGKNSFWSDKVAKPVIRVDRYSYGIGAFQPSATAAGEAITSQKYDTNGKFTDQFIKQTSQNRTTVPTAYVRVRIDCETRGAKIIYNDSRKTSKSISSDTDSANIDDTFEDKDLTDAIPNCKSFYTKTALSCNPPDAPANPNNLTNESWKEYSAPFAGGNGNYKQSCKQYIFAMATKGTGTVKFEYSSIGREGIFQTVLHIVKPIGKGRGNADGVKRENYCNQNGDGKKDLSIRGTTGFAGEPYISPFPLRDSQIGSPFLKRAYNERDNDYYWISYEILVDASFSNYCSNDTTYDWSRSWGIMYPGEFTRCINMRRW